VLLAQLENGIPHHLRSEILHVSAQPDPDSFQLRELLDIFEFLHQLADLLMLGPGFLYRHFRDLLPAKFIEIIRNASHEQKFRNQKQFFFLDYILKLYDEFVVFP
jgi:hypothetical protein